MATIKVNYDALQHTATDLSDESKRIFKLALEIERTMTKIPMKTTSQSLAKLKMARQCIGLTSASAKLMKFAVNLGEIGNVYKDADHRILVGGDDLEYAKYLNNNANGELSEDDVRRIKKTLNELCKDSFNDTLTNDEIEKIKLYNSLYEKAYPEEAERINKLSEGYTDNYYKENEDLLKYFLYSGSLSSDKYDDNVIKSMLDYSKDMSPVLFAKLIGTINGNDDCSYNSSNAISEKFGSDERYLPQGNACIYNFKNHKNSDGSTNVSFTITNSHKTYTEITVYNKDGQPIERVYMEGQRDPSSIPEVFSGVGAGFKDLFTGKFAHVDGDFSNAKQDYSFKVPAGGYIQITDDPNDMNYNSYISRKTTDEMANTSSLLYDTVGFESDNEVVNVGFDLVKGAASTGTKDSIKGTSTPVSDYAKDGAWTITEAIVTAGEGNPSGIGLKGIDYILKFNSKGDEYLCGVQQEKCEGNGSLFIY